MTVNGGVVPEQRTADLRKSYPVPKCPEPSITVRSTRLDGCFELLPSALVDARGSFTKIFHRPLWERLGLCTRFEEEYVTWSSAGTIRGLHFQVPPMQYHKVVICLRGAVLDVAVDLRRKSPTYKQHICIELSGELANGVYLPPGLAHGFCVTGQEALLYYKVSKIYSPEHDTGIRWDSAEIDWPIDAPLLAERDKRWLSLDEFDSPFILENRE
jgi:dTDP-4-dehydrorhamnose 3,5-epimerase